MINRQVIILFANLDDKPDNNSERGWINSFKDNLGMLLKRLEGKDYELMAINEYDLDNLSFPTEPCIIIPVFSWNFFQSPIFSGYLDVLEKEVIEKNKKTGRITPEFICVLKNRINQEVIPAYLLHSQCFNFFQVDSLTDYVTEIFYTGAPGKDIDYWLKIFDVSVAIGNYYKQLESTVKVAEEVIETIKSNGIYLSQSGLDLELERASIFRELRRNNYKVYELTDLDKSFDALENQVNGYLNKSFLSIHLIGEDGGKLIKDRGLSIVEIENQLAAAHSKQLNDQPGIKYANRFKRIIWFAPQKENMSVKQKLFIENLKKELVNIQYAELLDYPLEELKNYINNYIEQKFSGTESGSMGYSRRKKSIYFICDKSEYKECKPIRSLLEKEGYHVVLSDFDGELMHIRNMHNKNLKECDGTLIYYGNNNENWVKSKIFDSFKALGFGRKNAHNPTAVIVDANKKVDLDRYFQNGKLILFKKNQVSRESFEPFLSQLEQN